MHYEINVSLNKKHFFGTHERSIRSESKLKLIVDLFKQKFPESEGYEVSATYHEEISRGIKLD